MEGFLPLDRSRFPTEVVAGITLAALAIPEVMGYATIAGMPVVTGLYTIVLPMLVFAFLGSSRHLVVGADSATAAVMAAALAGMAATGSSEYVALAGLLALMAGALMIIARLIKLGFIADFLSRTVLIGFLTGVGIQVAIGQLAGLIGVPTPSGGSLTKLVDTIEGDPGHEHDHARGVARCDRDDRRPEADHRQDSRGADRRAGCARGQLLRRPRPSTVCRCSGRCRAVCRTSGCRTR